MILKDGLARLLAEDCRYQQLIHGLRATTGPRKGNEYDHCKIDGIFANYDVAELTPGDNES